MVDVTKDFETNEAEYIPANSFEVCIPDTILTSDITLSKLTLWSGSGFEGDRFISDVELKAIYWMYQYKQKYDGAHSTQARIDKYLLVMTLPTTPSTEIYFMCDLFYLPEKKKYVAKVLGSYNSLPKVVTVNVKNGGEVVAEKEFGKSNVVHVSVISSDTKLDRRASNLFFWLEKSSIFV